MHQWRLRRQPPLRPEHEPFSTLERFTRTVLMANDRQIFGNDRSFAGFFTLRDLDRMGRFHIRWTNNILEHLRVSRHRDDHFRPTLYMFQQARALDKLTEK